MSAVEQERPTPDHIIPIWELPAYHDRLLRAGAWTKLARPEQLPPEGDWRVWYLRGGRGSGKTRTGAETMAKWIREYRAEPDQPPLEWGIVAPTFGDARAVCVEGPAGLLQALGKAEVVSWNRSEGVLTTRSGSKVYTDGGDDGALRVQGHNLSGLWADEVGLWRDWDRAWNESIAFAVRAEIGPAKIIATGTPKMAHPLIAYLLKAKGVVRSHMRTVDNAANLDPSALADLLERYEGSTLGRQELEGEFIEALEGSILPRSAWLFYERKASMWPEPFSFDASPLPRFDQIVHSWDTALKAKTTNDHVAGQAWGCAGPDRYLLGLWCGHAGLEVTIKEMKGLLDWTREKWKGTPHRVLIENTSNGPDAITEMRKHVDGIYPVRLRQGDDKIRRAMTAAPALETGHCYLPGEEDHKGRSRGYGPGTPGKVQEFIEECAIFPIDDQPRTRSLRGREEQERLFDDQVDAWSQMVNWTRSQARGKSGITRAHGRMPRVGQLGA